MAAFILLLFKQYWNKRAQECVPKICEKKNKGFRDDGNFAKRCESGVVQKIYTTDSIYSGPQGKDSFVEVVGSFFPQI